MLAPFLGFGPRAHDWFRGVSVLMSARQEEPGDSSRSSTRNRQGCSLKEDGAQRAASKSRMSSVRGTGRAASNARGLQRRRMSSCTS